MNDIANVKVHLRTCRGNVNMCSYILQVLIKKVDKLAPIDEKKSRLGFSQYSDKGKVVNDILLGATKTRKQFEKKLKGVKQRKGK